MPKRANENVVAPRFGVKKRPAGSPAIEVERGEEPAKDAEHLQSVSFDDRLRAYKAFAYGGKDHIQHTPQELAGALRSHFTEHEMSNWWNKLSRDKNNDPEFAKNCDTVVKISPLAPSKAKQGVLALRIADPTNFRELVGEQSTIVSHSDQNSRGGRWMSRGQLYKDMGEHEAERKISKGKFEVRWDSDSDSEFYVKFQKDKNKQ